jgi:hypothetical protein
MRVLGDLAPLERSQEFARLLLKSRKERFLVVLLAVIGASLASTVAQPRVDFPQSEAGGLPDLSSKICRSKVLSY